MAIGDAYATVAQYRTVKGNPESAEDDIAIERDLKAVARFIDLITHRPVGFNKDASNVDRIYMVEWQGTRLEVDDLVSVGSVVVDKGPTGTYNTTVVEGTDFELYPLNAARGPEARPYWRLDMLPWATTLKSWPKGARVKITGVFGWPAVPSAVVSANIELTAILRIESPRATNRVNELNTVFTSTSRQAQGIVEDLVRRYDKGPVVVGC